MKHLICIIISGLTFFSSIPLNAQTQFHEVSHYLFPEFTRGVVLIKGGIESEKLLNYNSLTEEMVFENMGMKLAIAPNELARIDTVYIKDRKFIVLNDHFVELLQRSEWELYAEHKCDMEHKGKPSGYGGTSQTTAVTSYSSYYSEGALYDLELPVGYETRPYIHYWLNRDGELSMFKSMRDLKKLYKEKAESFKTYVKEQNVEFDNQESIIKLIGYLESN